MHSVKYDDDYDTLKWTVVYVSDMQWMYNEWSMECVRVYKCGIWSGMYAEVCGIQWLQWY